MDTDELVDLMNRQIVAVQAQLEAQMQRGENPEGTGAVLRSLRLSIQAFSSGLEPGGGTGFALFAEDGAPLELRCGRRQAAVSGAYLRALLDNAGVSMTPGEILLVEPALARRLVEESLGEAAAEESGLEKRRGVVLTVLRQSSGLWKQELQLELERLDAREAGLRERKRDLIEMAVLARSATTAA